MTQPTPAWNYSDPRLQQEHEWLQKDYEARRASMLKLVIVEGVIVFLALIAMFLALFANNSAISQIRDNQTTLHSCTNAKLNEILTGGHNINPIGC